MPEDTNNNKLTRREKLITAGVGAGIAIPAFVALRKPWKKKNLAWVEDWIPDKHGKGPGLLTRAKHYINHGTTVAYHNPGTGKLLPGEERKLKNVSHVLGTPRATEKLRIKHKPFEEAYRKSGGRRAAARMENKLYQARKFKNIPTVKYKGQSHEQLTKRFGGHYVIKEVNSYNSGGGHLYSINHSPKEVKKQLAKYRKDRKTVRLAQADLVGIKEKDIYRRMGRAPEYRVHTLHGKVLPGTSDRWIKGEPPMFGRGVKSKDEARAEHEVRKALRKMNPKERKNLYGFDVMKTKEHGFKVIEANPTEHAGISGHISQPKASYPLYKRYTGKAPIPEAARKAVTLGVGGSAAVGGYYKTSKGDKK